MTLKLATLAALALVSGSAMAADGTGFYVGADIGQASSDIKKGEIDSVVFGLFGAEAARSSLDTSDTTFSLFFGYQILPYLAVEASYVDLGKSTYKASGTYPGEPPVDVNVKLDWESKGPTVSVLGILPFADVWDVYGRLGAYFADTKITARASSATDSASDHTSKNTTEFLWGVGAGYTFLDHWKAQIEYQGFPDVGDKNHTGEATVDRITLGMLYRF